MSARESPGGQNRPRMLAGKFIGPMRGTLSQIWRLLARLWRAFLEIGKPRPKFPNVPDKLTVFVRDHMKEFERTGQRQYLYLEAAGGAIAQYLQILCFAKDSDPFLGWNKANARGEHEFPVRIISIGETLFVLRNCKGFPEICRRLKEHDLRSAYYEMLAAKIFFRAGFEIEMWPAKQVLGEDFDFTAVRKQFAINVEVTALKEKDFYEKTAINAIHWKRRQLPKDKPAVIFCVIPAQWENLGFDINEWTASVADKFFRSGSRRVNRLVFYLERLTKGTSGGGWITIMKTYDHPNPYFSCNLDHIFEMSGKSELMQLIIEDSIDNPELAKSFARQSRTGEFYEWVDSFHDE
jgi:hypothetical protein